MAPVIEFEGLGKEYRRRGGRTVAVDDLDLCVPEGTVYGFLGPNGSGKTTTIRMLVGLVRPSRGRARLFGEEVPGALPHQMRRVGAIVESPAMFPTMTARENLRLLARIDGIGSRHIERVLDQVGLADRAGEIVRKYSLGMRQRLGLAAALLKDPALVVLDEPANGLDPAGIRQVRELLRGLGREGRTVFLSSHILSEVEHTCDMVAILRRGRCVAEGSVASVIASAGPSRLLVKVEDLPAGLAVLRRAHLDVERVDGHLRVTSSGIEPGEVTRLLAADQLWVTDLRSEEHSLEELFFELTTDDMTIPQIAEAPA